MSYFECNLPKTAPYWLHADVYPEFQSAMDRIHDRMERLEEALKLSGLDGATFAKHAKVLFDAKGDGFDLYSAEKIAEFVKLMDDGTKAEPRMEWPNAIVVVDTAFVSRTEWESIRHFGIGGSDASVILGMNHYQTPSTLYHTKVGTPDRLNAERKNSWVLDRGHKVEDSVISAFCKLTGAKVIPETRMFASMDYPNCTANIDAIVRFDDGRMYVFEAKTTVSENWASWVNDKIPPAYVPQTRQYPAVLNDDRILGTYIGCIFTDDVVFGGEHVDSAFDIKQMKVRFVDRDLDAEESQLIAESEWFETYVENRMEPPADGNPEQEIEQLRKMIGAADPTSAPVQWSLDEFGGKIEEYLQLSETSSKLAAEKKSVDEKRKSISHDMIEKLGTSVTAYIPLGDSGHYEIKYAPKKGTKVDTDKLLDLFETTAAFLPAEMQQKLRSCVQVLPEASRVFSLKKKAGVFKMPVKK